MLYMEQSVKERLIHFIKYKGLSQGKFEKMCGMSNAFVNNIRSSIQPEKLLSIAKCFPELNIGWLLIGEEYGGKMLKGESIHQQTTPPGNLPMCAVASAQAVLIANWTDLEPVVEKVVSKVMGGK